MNRIEEIKERWSKTTPAPWRWGDWDTNYYSSEPEEILKRNSLEHAPVYDQWNAVTRNPDFATKRVMYAEKDYRKEDAVAIACAPDDIQYLLAKLEQADITLTKALEGDGVLRQYEEVVEDYAQLHSAVSEALKAIRE